MGRRLKRGDSVLANFTGGLEEGRIFDVSMIGGQEFFSIQSKRNPTQKVGATRSQVRDILTGL
jgi:FKBP-type peptidyl-prolyl cis-trans isomerase